MNWRSLCPHLFGWRVMHDRIYRVRRCKWCHATVYSEGSQYSKRDPGFDYETEAERQSRWHMHKEGKG